ncbi:MAG: HAMP domain-containing protein, partial [Bdellovibrionia bacterium]
MSSPKQVNLEAKHFSKIRFISFQVKFTVLSALLVFVSLSIVGALSYLRILSSNIEPLVGKRLDYSARGIALTVPGEKYQKIITTYLKSPKNIEALPEFKQIQQFLLNSQRQNELTADVQTFIKDPLNPAEMIALVTSNEESGIKHLPLDPWIARVLKEGLPVFTPIYLQDGGMWISGFAPIETEKGDITGVIKVNYEASQEVSAAKKGLLNILATAGAAGFALTLIMGFFLGRTLSRPVKDLSSAAKEVMKGNLNPSLVVTSNDEIGTLASIFKNMIAEIRNSRESLEDYSKNLETKVKDRTSELKEANQKTEAMLDSLGQGFFLFQADGKCLPIHSKACLQLLEGSPEGKNLGEYLRADLKGGIYDWVNALFLEPLPFESIAPLGINYYPHSEGLIVELSYRPIRDDEGKVKLAIVIATDRTAEIQAQETAEIEKSRSRRILLIMENKDQFLSFIRELNQIIGELEILNQQQSPLLVAELTRGLHTIKGGAALFQFQSLRELAHRQEAEVSQIAQNMQLTPPHRLVLSSIIDSVRKEFSQALLELQPILGDTLHTGVKSYSLLEPVLTGLLKTARESGISRDLVESWEKDLLHEPLIEGFKHFNEVVLQAANKLGKRIQPIVFEGG